MEATGSVIYNKEQILKQFNQLLNERKKLESYLPTRSDQFQKAETQKIVAAVSEYTVESIVKGLAELQLDFKTQIDTIALKLSAEANKLQEVRRALQIENQHLNELRQIRIVVEALDLLIEENNQQQKNFEENTRAKFQTLEAEIDEAHKKWEQEEKAFSIAQQEKQAKVKKDREQAEADFRYEVERKRKMEFDKYEEQKKLLERRLAEAAEKDQQDWSDREKFLLTKSEEIESLKVRVTELPQVLAAAIEKARDETTREAQENANLETQLFENEAQATQEMHKLKIASLEEIVQKQGKEIEDLSGQLQQAIRQVQELTLKTVGKQD
jgi:hypothetical protein